MPETTCMEMEAQRGYILFTTPVARCDSVYSLPIGSYQKKTSALAQ